MSRLPAHTKAFAHALAKLPSDKWQSIVQTMSWYFRTTIQLKELPKQLEMFYAADLPSEDDWHGLRKYTTYLRSNNARRLKAQEKRRREEERKEYRREYMKRYRAAQRRADRGASIGSMKR